jgi:hypothetical protein
MVVDMRNNASRLEWADLKFNVTHHGDDRVVECAVGIVSNMVSSAPNGTFNTVPFMRVCATANQDSQNGDNKRVRYISHIQSVIDYFTKLLKFFCKVNKKTTIFAARNCAL